MSDKKKVYVETTVISDLTSRPSPLVRNLARQLAKKEWWDEVQGRCEFYVSQLVDAESARGDEDAAKRRQEFLSGLTWIEYGPAALELARKFLDAAAIPETSFDDATHVAIRNTRSAEGGARWKRLNETPLKRFTRRKRRSVDRFTPTTSSPPGSCPSRVRPSRVV